MTLCSRLTTVSCKTVVLLLGYISLSMPSKLLYTWFTVVLKEFLSVKPVICLNVYIVTLHNISGTTGRFRIHGLIIFTRILTKNMGILEPHQTAHKKVKKRRSAALGQGWKANTPVLIKGQSTPKRTLDSNSSLIMHYVRHIKL